MSLVPKVQMSPQGPKFSTLVQGYWRMAQWNLNPQQRLSFIKNHIELGITTVDHAAVYGGDLSCESLFGEALKLDSSLRDQIEIVSKCGICLHSDQESPKVSHYNNSQKAMISSVEQSLSRLNVEYLDVLLIHRLDYLLDADEVAETFSILKKSGKVKYLGVSNFSPSQFSLLQSRLDESLVTNQVEINPVHFSVTEDGTMDQLQQRRVRPMAWSSLAGGKIFHEQSERMVRLRSVLHELANEIEVSSIEEIIYAWVMRLPVNPVVILGSGSQERISTAVKSLDITLSQEQWYRIWVASKGHTVP